MIKGLAQAMGDRAIGIVSRVPEARRADVSVIAFVVRAAAADARHQVVEVAVDVGDSEDRCWQPSAFAFPNLGSFGDPADDALTAKTWSNMNKRYNAERWRAAAGMVPARHDAADRLTPLTSLRGLYLSVVPHCARLVRRRLRRRVGWRDQWTMFVVTDAAWDQAYPASELVNDGPLPPRLVDYLALRYEGAVEL